MKRIIIVFMVVLALPIMAFSQDLKGIDEIAPFSDGLAAVRQGNQWGFINQEGALVIDFRSDLLWNKDANTSRSDIKGVRYPMFKEGKCIVWKMEGDIPLYGFMDKTGVVVIEPQFLNVQSFENGYTTGVLFRKVLMGQNEIKMSVYDYKFNDVLMDSSGKIVEFFGERENIQMRKNRYELPSIWVNKLSDKAVAVKTKGKGWDVRKLALEN